MNRAQPAVVSLFTPAGQRKYLTADERQRFLRAAEAARPAVRTLCLTLVWTGCRLSEALALTGAAFDPQEGSVAIRCLKKRRPNVFRSVPLPPALLDCLGSTYALGNPASADRLWPLSRGRGWQWVKQVMVEASIAPGPHATAKGLRHAYALHAIRSGVPLHLVQRWLGHASMATTAIYLHAVGTEEREIAERMWQVLNKSQ